MKKEQKEKIQQIVKTIEKTFETTGMYENEKKTKQQLEEILAGISPEEKESIIKTLKERKDYYSK